MTELTTQEHNFSLNTVLENLELLQTMVSTIRVMTGHEQFNAETVEDNHYRTLGSAIRAANLNAERLLKELIDA